MDLITVIVPCYNEQESLPLFYPAICKIADQLSAKADFEFLFIDDGSKDKTVSILRELHEKDDRVHYVSFSRNFGKEAGIYAGLENASGDYVVVMDADLQHPPEFIPKMYEYVSSGEYDCASTRRVSREGEKKIRSMFSSLFYKLNNKISQVKMVEGAQDYRFMTRQVVNAILELKEYNRFSKGIFSWVGFKTKYIEYENVERAAGETKWSFWSLFLYSLEGIFAFSSAPLAIPMAFGVIFCVIGFILLILSLLSGVLGITLSFIYSILFIIAGVQLVCLGIFAQYFSKLYWEVKNRPVYIAKEIVLGKRGK